MGPEALSETGASAPAEAGLGEAAFAAGDASAGAAHFRRAIELEPSRFDRRLVLAKLLAKAGRDAEAVDEIETTAREGKAILSVLAQTGAAAAAIGRPDIAARLFAEAVTGAHPKAPAVWRMSWANQLDRLFADAGDLEAKLANRAAAEKVLKEGLAEAAEDERQAFAARLTLVQTQAQRANALDAARLGEAAFETEDLTAAIAHQRRSLELEPGRFDRRLTLARFLATAGQAEQAASEIEATAREGGEILSVLAQAGAAAASINRPDLAATLFARAVESSSPKAPAAWRMSWVNQLDRLLPPASELEDQLANRAAAVAVLEAGVAESEGEEREAFAARLEQVRAQSVRARAHSAVRQGEAAFAAGDAAAGAAEMRQAIELEPGRAEHRLNLARRLGAAGLADEASTEIAILADQPALPGAILAQAGGVESWLDHPGRACALFERAVASEGDAPGEWTALWANQLDRMALAAPGLTAFLENRRRAEAVVREARTHLAPEAAARVLLNLRLANILWQIDDPALASLVEEMIGGPAGAFAAREAALLAPVLKDVVPLTRIRDWLAATLAKQPDEGALLTSLTRACLGDAEALAPLWEQLLKEEQRWGEGAAELVGLAAFDLGRFEIAHDRLAAAAERGARELWRKAGEAALHIGRDDAAQSAFARAGPRLEAAALGPLADALESLLSAVNRTYLYEDEIDHAALSATLDHSLSALQARLTSPSIWTPAALFEAAMALDSVRRLPFRFFGELPQRMSYVERFDARYGILDLEAFSAVGQALLEHEAAMLDRSASLLLEGAAPGGLQLARFLPRHLTEVLLELGRGAAARGRLQDMAAAGLASEGLRRAFERCALDDGNFAELRRTVQTGSVHPTLYADEWRRREGLTPTKRLDAPSIVGIMERAGPDGAVARYLHQTTSFRLDVTEVRDLEVRQDELIIGPGGSLLRPPDWHVRRGDYPREYGLALNAAASAAVLRRDPVEIIEEPVLVLAGADPLSRPNYYHWMIYQLTRAVWAAREGWLDGRRLFVPAQSRRWMFEALDLAGVTADLRLSPPPDVSLRLRDAWLVSDFDYPPGELLRATREQMWRGACETSAEPPAGRVFLIRPPGSRRPVFAGDKLLEAARARGFACVEPGCLTVVEQVRLLAQAKAVAGFGGAAMTNILFASPGARILDLTSEATLWPDFSGIAIALGQHYRHLPGIIPPACRSSRHLEFAPTRYDPELLADQMAWADAAEADRAGVPTR